ncbi:hypothetical protein RJ640_015157 [Escallonia rubra]|uniref:Uncharacterized protein n=1 Tax=Escallonia rubra TaxID=112253 RepID=A0AA88RZS0_9ASTE|nr:hypothetical protein RJ640_015157 [Escallonia rubra]
MERQGMRDTVEKWRNEREREVNTEMVCVREEGLKWRKERDRDGQYPKYGTFSRPRAPHLVLHRKKVHSPDHLFLIWLYIKKCFVYNEEISTIRNNGRSIYLRKATLHNGWVVPYNPYLLAKFNCHINVEICSSIKAVKYLYKYIDKGHDRVLFQVVNNETSVSIDEISQFQSARWESPPELAWRIFGFPLNDIAPSVMAFHLHLPNLQSVVLHEIDDLAHLASDNRTSRTMLTEFFRINQLNKDGPKYLYSEFPEHNVWNYGYGTWEPRHQRFSVGRIRSHFIQQIEDNRWSILLIISSSCTCIGITRRGQCY